MSSVKTAMVRMTLGLDIVTPHTIFDTRHVERPYGHTYISYVRKRRPHIYIILYVRNRQCIIIKFCVWVGVCVCDKGGRKAFSLCYVLHCVYYIMSGTRKTQKSSTRKRKPPQRYKQ